MAKKNKRITDDVVSGDFSKGFSTGAFSGLKSLQNIRKAEEEERTEQEKREADAQAKREEAMRLEAMRMRDFRFTEADLHDESDLTDEEIFEQSMMQMDSKPVDVYQSKFNVKEAPKPTQKDASAPLTMTDEEREFALFTQEMALSNVKRLTKTPKPAPKQRNKKKYSEPAILEDFSPVNVDAAPTQPESGMKTDFIAPQVAVTQVEKGEDLLERPDINEAMTTAQKQLLKDVKRYESRYGMVITLKLRGLTLNAAISRLDDFMSACIREHKPYALVICGKGLGSAGEPVIKNAAIDMFRSDKRVTEYAPLLNSDGDFGSIYIALKKS
ncbi:MAG: Smr/MutS family protein [Proteobacteria bacterium]|nr:Smr/MutS family protein [Pseudomonadota bacterium]